MRVSFVCVSRKNYLFLFSILILFILYRKFHKNFTVGPCIGIDAGDQLMMSRYILQRVCEDFQVFW